MADVHDERNQNRMRLAETTFNHDHYNNKFVAFFRRSFSFTRRFPRFTQFDLNSSIKNQLSINGIVMKEIPFQIRTRLSWELQDEINSTSSCLHHSWVEEISNICIIKEVLSKNLFKHVLPDTKLQHFDILRDQTFWYRLELLKYWLTRWQIGSKKCLQWSLLA